MQRPLLHLVVLLAAAAPTAAQCGEDGFEDNDTCGGATVAATPFVATGLAVYKQTDPDYFRITVPPGDELNVDIFFSHAVADLDLRLYDAGGPCGGLQGLAQSTSSNDDEQIRWSNLGSTPRTVIAKVEVFPGSPATCNTYDLTITSAPPLDPCDPLLSDDHLEDNDSCAMAIPLPTGVTPGLWVSRTDGDFYRTTLQPGATLDAEILFVDSIADLDLFLYDAAGPCGGGFGSGELASGFTQTNNERIIWSNTGGSPRDVILHVDVFDADNCNSYTLDVVVGSGGIGTNYCQANPNSTGQLGLMRANGTTSIAANDVELRATQLPAFQFGIFVNSRTPGFVPNAGGSTGNLCLGGSIGRDNAGITSSGAGGVMARRLNLNAIPQGSGFESVLPGQTWYFQAWHRDVNAQGQPTSNLTNGIRITFQA